MGLIAVILAVGIALQAPFVQLIVLRAFVIPQIEKSTELNIKLGQCNIGFLQRTIGLFDVQVQDQEVRLLSIEKLVLHWDRDQANGQWTQIESVDLEQITADLTALERWKNRQEQDSAAIAPSDDSNTFGFSVDQMNITGLTAEVENGASIVIHDAHMSEIDLKGKDQRLKLDDCSGLAVLSVSNADQPDQIRLDIASVKGVVDSDGEQWSIASFSAVTSGFSASINRTSGRDNWDLDIQFEEALDVDSIPWSPAAHNVASAVLKSGERPRLGGRVWRNAETRSFESSLSPAGLSSIGTRTDSLKLSMDTSGDWQVGGAVDMRWRTAQKIMVPLLSSQQIPFVMEWSEADLTSLIEWQVSPMKQSISLNLPFEKPLFVQCNSMCSPSWTPVALQGSFEELHAPDTPFNGDSWSGQLHAEIGVEQTTVNVLATSNASETIELQVAKTLDKDSMNRHLILANWDVQSPLIPVTGSTEFSYDDSAWQMQANADLNGIQSLGLPSEKEWSLFASLNLRASGNVRHQWSAALETRNINLLENGRPMAFSRFDAIARNSPDSLQLEWHSDVSNGKLVAENDLETWREWIQRNLHGEEQVQRAPLLDLRGSLMDFRPLALLTGSSLDFAPLSQFSASNDSDGLLITADIPSFSSGPLWGTGLTLNWKAQEKSKIEISLDTLLNEGYTLGFDLRASLLTGDSWQGALSWNNEHQAKPADLTFSMDAPDAANGTLEITHFEWPIFEQHLHLIGNGDFINWSNERGTSPVLSSRPVKLTSEDWSLEAQASLVDFNHWIVDIGFDLETGKYSPYDGSNSVAFSSLAGRLIAESNGDNQDADLNFGASHVSWKGENISDLVFSGIGWTDAFTFETISKLGDGGLQIEGDFGKNQAPLFQADWIFQGIEIQSINQLIPENAVALHGTVDGHLQSEWNDGELHLIGTVHTDSLTTNVPAIGTEYVIAADAEFTPEFIQINQGEIRDRLGANARLNGTAYHEKFKNWDLDFGIDATLEAIELMNLAPKEDAYFFGQAIGTGDINVSGFGEQLRVEANLIADEGTDFSIPLDAIGDENYAQFIQFKSQEDDTVPTEKRGDFSNVILDIGLDIRPDAIARILFNQNTGEEITGRTEGHLDLRVDDFEKITLNGALEITKGTYFFTLQNLINKTFDIVPGGTIEWFGDPYEAQINLLTSYQTRAKLNPLLPDEPNLPGRVPVELSLALNGALFAPEIGFNIQIPEANSRLEALVEGALLNEEEIQRQAISLLVINQFVSQDPLTSALGGFQGEGKTSGFIANQLGHWISQISPGVDLGLDYANDDLSGEQELALALSTQLFDERLRIEGAVGAQTVGQMSTDDIQIQDVTISYDLDSKGQYQVTGHSKSNPSMVNALDGTSSQGVGIRMKHEFDNWGDWRKKDKQDGEK